MKARKLFLVLVLVVVLLLGSVLVASAADKIKLTGGTNNSFFGLGWEWANVNISVDPETGEAEGRVSYKVYVDDGNPKYWESWEAEAICGVLGEYQGIPTLVYVIQIVEQKNIDPSWVGKYAKLAVSDGGQNASEDLLGIVVWDFPNNMPVSDQPTCEFAEPELAYPSQNGNFTIHE